jgi:hypothetical protein
MIRPKGKREGDFPSIDVMDVTIADAKSSFLLVPFGCAVDNSRVTN